DPFGGPGKGPLPPGKKGLRGSVGGLDHPAPLLPLFPSSNRSVSSLTAGAGGISILGSLPAPGGLKESGYFHRPPDARAAGVVCPGPPSPARPPPWGSRENPQVPHGPRTPTARFRRCYPTMDNAVRCAFSWSMTTPTPPPAWAFCSNSG